MNAPGNSHNRFPSGFRLDRVLLINDPRERSGAMANLSARLRAMGTEIELSSGASGMSVGEWLRLVGRNDVLVFTQLQEAHSHFRRQLILARLFGCCVIRLWVGIDVAHCRNSSRKVSSALRLNKTVDLNISTSHHLTEDLSNIGIRAFSLSQDDLFLPAGSGMEELLLSPGGDRASSIPEEIGARKTGGKKLERWVLLFSLIFCQLAVSTETLRKNTLTVWTLTRLFPSHLTRLRFPRAAEKMLDDFKGQGSINKTSYENLFRYFAEGWNTCRESTRTGAAYPGLPSWSGERLDKIEGFSRIMPLFGAWCASGRNPEISLPGSGVSLSLVSEFKRGLLAGTDPGSETYWGDMPGKSNQLIVEAADIALSLWLFREHVWTELSGKQREAVVNWLSLVEGRHGLDNNWHLFFVIIDRVLAALGHPGRISGVRKRFERIKEFHIGDGWFTDGPEGKVDFYNAWGFHYGLTWIDRLDPEWDPGFIHASQRRFLAGYKYLIGPRGLPILGRSVHYRLAAPAPLVAAHDLHSDIVTAAQARRALDAVWSHFIQQGAVRYGTVSQGYYRDDYRLVDPYSGPASSLWSLRSLVMAFYYPETHPFWTSQGGKLPVEEGDFRLKIEGPQWLVRGDRSSGTITVEILENPPDAAPGLRPFGKLEMLRGLAEERPRPANKEARYGRRYYRSDLPFWQ